MMNTEAPKSLRFNVVYRWAGRPGPLRLAVFAAVSREALLSRFAEDGAVVVSATPVSGSR